MQKISTSVAVIAAHPDDEVLGCGGVMARHASAGDHVHVLILAEGITSREIDRDAIGCKDDLAKLSDAAHEASRRLGVTSLTLMGFPDNRLDSVDLLDLTKVIEDFLSKCKAQVVYTHHGNDLNVDHRRISQAAVTASRPLPTQVIRRLLFFEVASSTEWQVPGYAQAFCPNCFIDISATLDRKLAALECYKAEMRPWPHARSIRAIDALARWRGASVGLEAAEAFVVARDIIC